MQLLELAAAPVDNEKRIVPVSEHDRDASRLQFAHTDKFYTHIT